MLIPKIRGRQRIILAIDIIPKDSWSCLCEVVKVACEEASGIKIGLPLILSVGIEKTRELTRICTHTDSLIIADLKLADIGDVMVLVLEKLKNMGFNAVIAHAFIGCEDALYKLSQLAHSAGVSLISVVAMSHRGADELLNKHFVDLVSISTECAHVEGLVVPATRPQIIRAVRDMVGDRIALLSPGVGVQGAPYGSALINGADYEIIGRAILKSHNPIEMLRLIAKRQREVLIPTCGGS